MKLWAAALVLLVAGSSLVACSGESKAAAESCTAAVGKLKTTMSTHPTRSDPRVGRAARASFTQCGSAAFWTVPAQHDDLAHLIAKQGSLHDDLWTICNRYDPGFETPVCEDRHENG